MKTIFSAGFQDTRPKSFPLRRILLAAVFWTVSSCGEFKSNNLAAPNNSNSSLGDGGSTPAPNPGQEVGSPSNPTPGAPPVVNPPALPPTENPPAPGNPVVEPSDPPPNQFTTVTISQAVDLRTNRSNILEKLESLPAGSVLQLYPETRNYSLDFRNDKGEIERSSTGFLFPLRILAIPSSGVSQGHIDQLNLTSTGLYVSAVIEKDIHGIQGKFGIVPLGSAGAGFLKHFNDGGKPKTAFTSGINKRFPGKINKPIVPSDRVKYQKIYAELLKVANRTVETDKGLLMIPIAEARNYSVAYEDNGYVNPFGAWSIAVEATAVRHGFPNVPCAEFMSEIVRQAYKRAGYSVHDDFNKAKGNQLIWSATAAVVNLSAALVAGGWVPWDPQVYRPPVGALLFHENGKSPGHTYISAGHDGQFIVDNGAPQGRNLRVTVEKTVGIMYRTGMFILPPGIQPQPW